MSVLNDVDDFRQGVNPVSAIYHGVTKIWPAEVVQNGIAYVDGAYDVSGGSNITLSTDGPGTYILAGAGQNTSSAPLAYPSPPEVTNFQPLGGGFDGFDAALFCSFDVGSGVSSVTVNAGWAFRVGWALYRANGFDPSDPASFSVQFENKNHQGSALNLNVAADDTVLFSGTSKETATEYRSPGPHWVTPFVDNTGTTGAFSSTFISETFISVDPTFEAALAATSQTSRDVAAVMKIGALL